jgi:hypothetical protein
MFAFEPQSLVKMTHKQASFSLESQVEQKTPSSAGLTKPNSQETVFMLILYCNKNKRQKKLQKRY